MYVSAVMYCIYVFYTVCVLYVLYTFSCVCRECVDALHESVCVCLCLHDVRMRAHVFVM